MKYPTVPDEFATMRALIKSRESLSRYGDGEFKLALGGVCVSQRRDDKIAVRLREILRAPQPGLTVCIPRIAGRHDLAVYSPKNYEFWGKIASHPAYVGLLSDQMRYGSSFITRMDNAIHIHCAEYWRMVQELFRGADVVVVSGQFKGSHSEICAKAERVRHIQTKAAHAWEDREQIMSDCLGVGGTPTFYLSCGATATVLAADLCAAGYRALDMGAMHRFWMGGRKGCAE